MRKEPEPAELTDHTIQVHLDELLTARGMTLTELSARTGTTIANLSILKNGRARAVRFTTLTAICHALTCQPGDILTFKGPPPVRLTESTSEVEAVPNPSDR